MPYDDYGRLRPLVTWHPHKHRHEVAEQHHELGLEQPGQPEHILMLHKDGLNEEGGSAQDQVVAKAAVKADSAVRKHPVRNKPRRRPDVAKKQLVGAGRTVGKHAERKEDVVKAIGDQSQSEAVRAERPTHDVSSFCVLCGTQACLEWRSPLPVIQQVAERYRAGPFAWQRAKQAEQLPSEQAFCVHCLNHIRKRKPNRTRHMLPMDQYLLGLLSPGLGVKVDLRSSKRLARVISQPCNPFRQYGVAPLQELVDHPDPARRWWELNLRTLFFADHVTARIIRQCV